MLIFLFNNTIISSPASSIGSPPRAAAANKAPQQR